MPLIQTPAAPDPSGAVGEAIIDLAERLISSITVVSVEEVTWPDTSLGCPEPDRAYLQVLVPGLRIVLAVGDVTYSYHAGQGLPAIYCEHPEPPLEDLPTQPR